MSLDPINELIQGPIAKNYKLMTDIKELQIGSLVKYIRKDDLTKICLGGQVICIEKTAGDYNINLENNNIKVTVSLSNVFILYRIKTIDDYKQEQFELWMGRYVDDSLCE